MSEAVNNHYAPTEETISLFTRYCGISSAQDIAERAARVRAKALVAHPYRCIQEFWFMDTRVAQHPNYEQLLHREDRNERKVLDIGCCMATDIRVMLLDGFAKEENLIGVDVCKDFISLGYELFGDEGKLKCQFKIADLVQGDIHAIFGDQTFDVIYCGSVFHLLPEDQCILLAQNASKLLGQSQLEEGVREKKEARRVFFGKTVGSALDTPIKKEEQLRYLHNKQSLKELLERAGFEDVEVTERGIKTTIEVPKETTLLAFTAYKS